MPPARCQPFHLPHALRLQTKTVGMLSFLRTAGLAADTGNGQQGTGAQFVNFVAINDLALCTWLGSVLWMPYCSTAMEGNPLSDLCWPPLTSQTEVL